MKKIFSNLNLGFLFLILGVLISSGSKAAPIINVQSTVDRNEMGVGDSVQLTVSVSSSENVEVQEPKVPHLNGFNLLNSGSSTSTSTKLVQGPSGMQFQTQKRYDFIYLLGAQKKGTITIPAFEVTVEGKNYFTKPIVVKVSEHGSGATVAPSLPGLMDEEEMDEADRFLQERLRNRGTLPPDAQFKTSPKNMNEAFFIQVELDKKEVYEGEQITASWYILTRGALMSLDRLKFPDLKGFWKEIIEEVPALNFTSEVINGVAYKKALLASHALFPIKAGDVYIDEYKIKASVALPTNPFSAFGLGRPYTYTKSSEKIAIKVKPIPTENRPADFAGAVGEFTAVATIEGEKFYANQPFNLKVRFEGEGNAKMIELPALNLPSSVEVYDTKSESKFFKNGKSYKEFNVLVIPRQKGLLQIPVLSFSFFDPKSKKFITTKTQEMKIEVLESVNAPSNLNTNNKETNNSKKTNEMNLKELLLAPIAVQDQGRYVSFSQNPNERKLFWGIVYFIVFTILLAKAKTEFFVKKINKDLSKEIKKRYKILSSLVDKSDYRNFGTQALNTVYMVLNEITNDSEILSADAGIEDSANTSINKNKMESIFNNSSTSESVEDWLLRSPPSLRSKHEQEIKSVVNQLQTLCFAPEISLAEYRTKDGLGLVFSKMKKLIDELVLFNS